MAHKHILKWMPTGERFCPSDQDLITRYLLRKLLGKPLLPSPLVDVPLYNYTPMELQKEFKNERANAMYLFTTTKKKHSNGKGTKLDRTAKDGYWRASNKVIDVNRKGVRIGGKRSLVYHSTLNGQDSKTNWLMQEFSIPANVLPSPPVTGDLFVLCKIYERNADHANVDKEPSQSKKRGRDDEENPVLTKKTKRGHPQGQVEFSPTLFEQPQPIVGMSPPLCLPQPQTQPTDAIQTQPLYVQTQQRPVDGNAFDDVDDGLNLDVLFGDDVGLYLDFNVDLGLEFWGPNEDPPREPLEEAATSQQQPQPTDVLPPPLPDEQKQIQPMSAMETQPQPVEGNAFDDGLYLDLDLDLDLGLDFWGPNEDPPREPLEEAATSQPQPQPTDALPARLPAEQKQIQPMSTMETQPQPVEGNAFDDDLYLDLDLDVDLGLDFWGPKEDPQSCTYIGKIPDLDLSMSLEDMGHLLPPTHFFKYV